MPINIIIADDDVLIRESLKIIFEMDERFNVVWVAEDGKEAYDICRKKEIDVALLDVRMPFLNGVEATAKIVSDTSAKVLILTTFGEDDYIKNAFLNGASGYLLKNNPPDQIKNAVISVNDGNAVVQDIVMEKIKNPRSKNNKEDKLKDLTLREREVVQLIAKGLTNKEIADNLFISEGTVRNTVSHVLGKLSLKHRTQIAIYYLEE